MLGKTNEPTNPDFNDPQKPPVVAISLLAVTLVILIFILIMNCSCTISFQNIATHGTANDLVDENQRTDPDIKPVIQVPLKP
jgi:hypothetical protein